jgi:hypothetical protein
MGLGWITGCGVKGPIIPPDLNTIKAVSQFQAFVRGEELLLTWDAPTDESRTDIIAYRIFSEDSDETKTCRFPCRKFRDLAFLDLEDGETDWIREKRVELRLAVDPALFWKTYHYVVVPVNRKGYAGEESREITIHWMPPPSKPEALQAQAGDRSVDLQWETPEVDIPLMFNIYRRTDDGTYPLLPVNAVPVEENRHLDKKVRNGTLYHYQIRALTTETKPWIESSASYEIEAIPVDLISPAPPEGLEAIPGQEIIRLFWEENKENDLSGYRVYRRSGRRGGFVQIGDISQPVTIFTDNDVQVGNYYEYYVSAYDNAPTQNESEPSRTVMVQP